MNPRSQVTSIGVEREMIKGLFVGADYVHQHWSDLDRTVDLNAPGAVRSHGARPGRTTAAAERDPADHAGHRRRAQDQHDA